MSNMFPLQMLATTSTSVSWPMKGWNMAKKFADLRVRMSPEPRARAAARTEVMLVAMRLAELRQARQVTQSALGENIGIAQAAVSRMERRDDMYLSTLSQYIEGLGGVLRLTAVFPDGEVEVRSQAPA